MPRKDKPPRILPAGTHAQSAEVRQSLAALERQFADEYDELHGRLLLARTESAIGWPARVAARARWQLARVHRGEFLTILAALQAGQQDPLEQLADAAPSPEDPASGWQRKAEDLQRELDAERGRRERQRRAMGAKIAALEAGLADSARDAGAERRQAEKWRSVAALVLTRLGRPVHLSAFEIRAAKAGFLELETTEDRTAGELKVEVRVKE